MNFVDITTVKLEAQKSDSTEPTDLPQDTTNTIGALGDDSTDSKGKFPWIYIAMAGGAVVIATIVAIVVIKAKRKKQP